MASDTNLAAVGAAAPAGTGEKTVFKILLTISFCHLLNDTIQSLMPPIYPLLQKAFHFNYWQVGRIALTSQLTASILQPLVGLYTDRRPKPSSLAVGMGITMWACWPSRWLPATARFSLPRRWWASGLLSFTLNLPASRAWLPADSTAWRSRFFRWAATPVQLWVRCWRGRLSAGNPALPGFRS